MTLLVEGFYAVIATATATANTLWNGAWLRQPPAIIAMDPIG